MTRTLPSFLLFLACSDPASAPPDGGSTADAGSIADAGSTVDGGDPGDAAGIDAGSGTECATDSASARIGAEGGSVSLCGASIDVAPGTLDAPAEFRIEHLGTPATEPPFELAYASSAFRFSSNATRLMNYLRITIPHTAAGRTIVPAAIADEEGWVFIEPCELNDTTAVIDTLALGPYVVFYETYDYPDAVTGLGGGTVTATFIDDSFTFDLDAIGNFAVRTEGPETHDVQIYATHDGTPYRRLIVTLRTDALGGSPQFVHASYATVTGPDVTTWESEDEAELAFTETRSHRHRGTLTVMMRRTDSTERVELTLDLDFTTEKWRWPPELACAVGHD